MEAVEAFARQRGVALSLVIGIILVVVGAFLSSTASVASLILLTVGGALVATGIVAWLALPKEHLVAELARLGVTKVIVNRVELGDDYYADLLGACQSHYRALGTSHHRYFRVAQSEARFKSAFQHAANKGVRVEVIWLKPDCPLASQRANEEGRATKRDAIISIGQFAEIREGLKGKAKANFTLREYEMTPSCGIVWADNVLVISNYLPAAANVFSPGLILRQRRDDIWGSLSRRVGLGTANELAEVYVGAFIEVAAKSTEINEVRLHQLKEALPAEGISESDLAGG
jgi:hypothetical protein